MKDEFGCGWAWLLWELLFVLMLGLRVFAVVCVLIACYFDVLCCWLFNYLLVLLVDYCLWFGCGFVVPCLFGSVTCVGCLWFVVVVIVVCWCCLLFVACLHCNNVMILHLIVCFVYWFGWFNYFFGNCVVLCAGCLFGCVGWVIWIVFCWFWCWLTWGIVGYYLNCGLIWVCWLVWFW